MRTTRQYGFTLVELATVLVIIGLILGLAFKGRDLIDGARVKSAQASVNKIQAAINIYYERYGAYPGDGCPASSTSITSCPATGRNSLINGTTEPAEFWRQLTTNTNILSVSDRNTPFGQQWNVIDTGTNLPTAGTGSWLVAGGDGTTAAVDIRYACAMDNAFDDGTPTTGNIRSNVANAAAAGSYNSGDDCWSSTKAGQGTLAIRVLP